MKKEASNNNLLAEVSTVASILSFHHFEEIHIKHGAMGAHDKISQVAPSIAKYTHSLPVKYWATRDFESVVYSKGTRMLRKINAID